ncbi:LOW QUALITY PROTEIN: hypothetical protein JCM24511_04245 [Saitozyma sp. JCM 24511]|nr:LOW QUALITY PROTEIN: hypothetical protein JCM24511_04245 [Saitozyma sp. JCM 24511]
MLLRKTASTRLLVTVVLGCGVIIVDLWSNRRGLGRYWERLDLKALAQDPAYAMLTTNQSLSLPTFHYSRPQDLAFTTLHEDIPETTWVTGVAGFNYFHNIYSVFGGFVAVTSRPETFPKEGAGYILSAEPEPDDETWNRPVAGPDLWTVVNPQEARQLLGSVAIRKRGLSMYFSDTTGLDHYYHSWRLVSSNGEHELPTRLMFRTTPEGRRDRAGRQDGPQANSNSPSNVLPSGLTPWFEQSVMPTTAIEENTILEDRAKSGLTFVYDRITISDRWAAHRFGNATSSWNKAAADLPLLPVDKQWLKPLRDSLRDFVVAEGCSIERTRHNVPVVTYINRQLTNRRLAAGDHEELIGALSVLQNQSLIEFNDAVMETMSRSQQIMIGVHGNGLTHQLWMKPGSGVVEIMDVGGFARDYSLLADLAGHEYFAIHRDAIFPRTEWIRPDGWAVQQTQGFHGPTIRADAPFVSNLVREMARDRQNVHEPSPSLSGRGGTNDYGDESTQMALLVDNLGLGR